MTEHQEIEKLIRELKVEFEHIDGPGEEDLKIITRIFKAGAAYGIKSVAAESMKINGEALE